MSAEKARSAPGKRRYVRGPHITWRNGFAYAYTAQHPKGRALKTRDAAVAQLRFRALLAQPDAPDVERAPVPETTLLDLATKYLAHPHGWTKRTHQSTHDRVTAFGAWCESKGLKYASEITDEHVSAWFKARMAEVSRRTVNRDWRVIAGKRGMLAWGAAPERVLCAMPPAVAARAGLREAKRSAVRYVPDAEEFARAATALESINAGAALAVRCLYATSLRIEELRRLTRWDLRGGAVHVRPEEGAADEAEPTKGYRERAIPVAPEVLRLVERFLEWRAGTGGKGKPVGCSESWLIKKLHKATKAAGVEDFGLHDLRAAFCTEAFDRGVGLVVIQGWMGHAEPSTTEGYIRPRRSDAKRQAPVPAGLFERVEGGADSVQKATVAEGPSPSQPFSGSDEETPVNPASPGRVELPTNGLGNRGLVQDRSPKTAPDASRIRTVQKAGGR